MRPEIRVGKKQMKCLVKDPLYLSLTDETSFSLILLARPTFYNATTDDASLPRSGPDLGSAFDWPCPHGKFPSTNQKLYPDLQWGISALLSQRSFRRETSSGIANVGYFFRLVTEFKIHLHIHIIDIPILTVCRMFET